MPQKRFYTSVKSVPAAGGHEIHLDGRPIKTPMRRLLALPDEGLAAAVAAEWEAQGDFIDPSAMPLTRLANSALDTVADSADEIAAEIVKYAGSDLLCYRAEGPASLVSRQGEMWDPILQWAHETLGARFMLAEGVMFVAQPQEALAAIEAAVSSIPRPFGLAAVHVMTTLMGSALLALAVIHGRFDPDAAWAAAHLDEDFQIEAWGSDEEAEARRQARYRDFMAAARFIVPLS